MSFEPSRSIPFWAGESSTASSAFQRGVDYLQMVQRLALEPHMVNGLENLGDRVLICTWIGNHIATVNARLSDCLQACHDCFHPQERRQVQVLAAPLSPALNLDGICNIHTHPITILVDVGRIITSDWLAIVAHEYAHAHLSNSGHDAIFATLLSHLCLGLGLAMPTWEIGMDTKLRYWPPCTATPDPLAYWQGQGSEGN